MNPRIPECPSPQGRFPWRMRRAAALAGFLLAAPFGVPRARAELIVFGDGRVVKAAGYRYVTLDLEGFRSGNLSR